MSKERKRVERLAREYKRSQEKIDAFVEWHEEIFDEYRALAIDRNIKLDKYKRALRETGVSAGPLEVSKSRKRIFDGEYLFNRFSDDKEIQQALIEVEYKVNKANFDAFVQSGRIEVKDAQKAIKKVTESNRVLHSPPEITF